MHFIIKNNSLFLFNNISLEVKYKAKKHQNVRPSSIKVLMIIVEIYEIIERTVVK